MKNFESYFSENDIVLYLCKLRACQAKTRSKKQTLLNITNNKKYNYHTRKLSVYEEEFKSDFDKLFPKRKQWKKIGESTRFNNFDSSQKGQIISSIKKNELSIYRTILYYQKNKTDEPFVIALNAFIKDLQLSITDENFNISKPIIYPKPKDNSKNKHLIEKEKICRPISLFNLKDRIILSFTNKFLTYLFDQYFEDCSLAFRAPRYVDKKKIIVTHHDAIKRILEYKNAHSESELYVAECDMQKFYDTVNHEKIVELFTLIIEKVIIDYPDLDINHAKRIFNSYLDCYSFNQNVLPLNDSKEYWEKYNILNGQFGWVQNELTEIYDKIENHKIGVPQGGALSGLIANIVLDYVDKSIIEEELFYIRFCDDMIMIHTKKEECLSKVSQYESLLKKLILIPHKFHSSTEFISKRLLYPKLNDTNRYPNYWRLKNKYSEYTYKNFWEGKSKSPYKWDSIENNGFPWIGFVGYEINYLGELRIRKSSLKKEIDKQNNIKKEITSIAKETLRKNGQFILRSVKHKLLGMSIGRVDIWNHDWSDNELCWVNGFKELNKNKHSIKQIKKLDRNRSKIIHDLTKEYEKIKVEPPKNENEDVKDGEYQVRHNKPFSYYYQALEKVRK